MTPGFSSNILRKPQRNNCLGVRDYVYSITERIDRPKKQKLANFYAPAFAVHNTLTAPCQRLNHTHLRSAACAIYAAQIY